MASLKALLIAAAVVVGALLPTTPSATVYDVGGQDGWVVGVDFNAWASDKDFRVGDSLRFVYPTEEEPISNALQVEEASFVACTRLGNAVMLTKGTGDDTVELSTPGHFCFICDVEDRCNDGMKFTIDVQY